MYNMFENASSFNADLSSWDVSNVTDMRSMFRGASSFNSDISAWDVRSLENYWEEYTQEYIRVMEAMFKDATSFNQDLSSWCVSQFNYAPPDFDTNATSWTEPRPVWGTCP